LHLIYSCQRCKESNFGEFLQSFKIQEQNITNLIIDLSYNTGGDELGKQLIWYVKRPKGFTEYLNNSDYFKTQIKQDYKKYNALYNEKYLTDLPKVK
jgi:hypothetical protein